MIKTLPLVQHDSHSCSPFSFLANFCIIKKNLNVIRAYNLPSLNCTRVHPWITLPVLIFSASYFYILPLLLIILKSALICYKSVMSLICYKLFEWTLIHLEKNPFTLTLLCFPTVILFFFSLLLPRFLDSLLHYPIAPGIALFLVTLELQNSHLTFLGPLLSWWGSCNRTGAPRTFTTGFK